MSVTARREQRAGTWNGDARIDSRADVERVLAVLADTRRGRDLTAGMNRVVDRADDTALIVPDAARSVPVVAELVGLLPWPGLRRGATIAATGSTSLLFALLAGGMQQGAFAAVVGMPQLCPLPAAEYGIDLARLALVPNSGLVLPGIAAADSDRRRCWALLRMSTWKRLGVVDGEHVIGACGRSCAAAA
jgi:hypothetical protein